MAMRRFILAGIGLLALTGAARADCAGVDLLRPLAADRPEAHAAVLAEEAAIENGQGRFWRVMSPGGGSASHLFGTYHDTEAMSLVPAPVLDALDAADRLVVELTAEEVERMEARIAMDPAFSFAFDAEGLGARLTQAERRLAEEALARRGLTVEVAAQLRPWMLFSLLGIPACQIEALSAGEEVLDHLLIERARARRIPVDGLETYEFALGAFAEIDQEAAFEIARDMLRLAPMEEDVRRTFLNLYAEGRIGGIAAFSDWLSRDVSGRRSAEAERLSDALDEKVLAARNRAWMARLMPALRRGNAFVAFGALHLPGEEGVVALLRDEGFTVERVDGID